LTPEKRPPARYRVTPNPVILHTLGPNYLSLTIDTSVLIGGHWWGESRGTKEGLSRDTTLPLDLENHELAKWSAPLAPCLIRVGGTEADRIGYGFHHDAEAGEVPVPPASGEPFVLKGKLWEQFNLWAKKLAFEVLFTVSAGPETRNPDGSWDSTGAQRLIRNTVRKGYPVVAWEFGNEFNAYPFLYGLQRSVPNRQYLKDFAVFANLVRLLAPGTLTVGPASAIWPLIGEPNPIIPALGRSPAAAFLDVLSFHYYPQQSSRGAVAIRRAKETTLLNARNLNGAARWMRYSKRSLSRGPARDAEIWLTEAGHALYGGQPGVSDTWLSTPWWLDQLGLLAQSGASGVFRQSLVGGDYGLLDPKDFSPRPDYFASLLWKRCMGPQVHLPPTVVGRDKRLRAYHHSHANGTQTMLVINLHRRRSSLVDLGTGTFRVQLLESVGGFASRRIALNGAELTTSTGLLRIRKEKPETLQGEIKLPPLSCAFVEF